MEAFFIMGLFILVWAWVCPERVGKWARDVVDAFNERGR